MFDDFSSTPFLFNNRGYHPTRFKGLGEVSGDSSPDKDIPLAFQTILLHKQMGVELFPTLTGVRINVKKTTGFMSSAPPGCTELFQQG